MVQEANAEASAVDAIVKVPELLHWAMNKMLVNRCQVELVEPESTARKDIYSPRAVLARARAGTRYCMIVISTAALVMSIVCERQLGMLIGQAPIRLAIMTTGGRDAEPCFRYASGRKRHD